LQAFSSIRPSEGQVNPHNIADEAGSA
jgi:hypothetical protein